MLRRLAVLGQFSQVCLEDFLTQELARIDKCALDLILGSASEMGHLGYRQVFDVMQDEGGTPRPRSLTSNCA